MLETKALDEICYLKLNVKDWTLLIEVDVEDGIFNWSVTKIKLNFTDRIWHKNS